MVLSELYMSCIVVVGLAWIYPSLCQLIMSVTPLRSNMSSFLVG